MPAGDAGGRNVKDMTGKKFEGLTVLHREGSRRGLALWRCKCPCGKQFDAVGAELRAGKVKTCGCRTSIKSRRNWQGYEGLSKTYWRIINGNASQRGIPFEITQVYIWQLYVEQSYRCALSGLPISLKLEDHTASLDRIDNTKGYVPGNVQWVHKDVNKLKGSFTVSRLLELCAAIIERSGI